MKIFPILVFASAILFFSCATSGEAAKNAFSSEDFSQSAEISAAQDSEVGSEEALIDEVAEAENSGSQNAEISGSQNAEIFDSQESENGSEEARIDEVSEIENSGSQSTEISDSQDSEVGSEEARIDEVSEAENSGSQSTEISAAQDSEVGSEEARVDEVSEAENPDSQNAEISAAQDSESETPEIVVSAEKIPQEEIGEMERRFAQSEISQPESVSSHYDSKSEEKKSEGAQTADGTEVAEAKIPSQGESEARIEETNLLDAEIVMTDSPARDEESSARNDLAERFDFRDVRTSDLEEANPENAGESLEVAETKTVVPSRTMRLKRNQYVDIIYPGSGWIYLGEIDGAEHFSFQGQSISDKECVFTLRSKKPGSAILHFYKNDALTGKNIDDYIAIEIGSETALDSSHVLAPSYALAVPKKFEGENHARAQGKTETNSHPIDEGGVSQAPGMNAENASNEDFGKNADASPLAENENFPAERVQTAIQDSRIEPQGESGYLSTTDAENSVGMKEVDANSTARQNDGDDSQDILRLAQEAYDEGRYADALSLLKRFFESAVFGLDAGLYLQGLVLEAKSEVRDIKSAIASYDSVVKNFPQSKFWKQANERAIYLKRFYINIR